MFEWNKSKFVSEPYGRGVKQGQVLLLGRQLAVLTRCLTYISMRWKSNFKTAIAFQNT